ncbi:MAG: hypothetical protein R3F59_29950 [Myxococcota bacterium]
MSGQRVRCTGCHREEQWADGERTVLAPGGSRRVPDPARHALDVVLAQGDRVVAVCPACGQPMVGDGTPIPWTLDGYVFAPDGTVTGPDGRVDRDTAAARVRERHPPPPREPMGVQFGCQVLLMVLILVPFAVWVFSVIFTTFFLSHASEAL